MTGREVPPVNPRLNFGLPADYSELSESAIDHASSTTCLVRPPEKLKLFNLWPEGVVTDWLVYERHHNPLTGSFETAPVLSYHVRQYHTGKAACTCSYFRASEGKRICQHIAEVLIHLEYQEKSKNG